jgi:CSLREA domain-containing protein
MRDREEHPLTSPRLIGSAFAVVALLPATAGAATITVNGTGDAQAEDAACTLREAIVAANTNTESGNGVGGAPECVAGQATPTEDTIAFSIAGAGPHVIAPGSGLPEVTEVVTVDGSTDGADEIALDGSASGGAAGLRLGGLGSTVRSLSIYDFGAGVVVVGSGGTVEDSFIGTNRAGAAGIGNSTGLSLSAANNIARGNVISGNDSTGVSIFSTGSTVAGNLIGTSPTGTAALPNGGGGINVNPSADSTTIGGPAALDGNVISGSTGAGISAAEVSSAANSLTGLVIEGNRIGTGIGGEAALANTSDGIRITGNVSGAAVEDNLVSGNAGDGIELSVNPVQPVGAPGPSQNTLSGNLVGTDKDGESPIPNGSNGISIGGNADHPAVGNTIGGATGLTPGGACTGDCNLVSGNPNNGIALDVVVEETQVLGNFVGTDITGTADIGNAFDGVSLNSASDSEVGSPAAPNVVSGNGADGIRVANAAADNEVQANLVGVDAAGEASLSNDGNGVLVNGVGTDRNLVGGAGVGEGNLIADNDLDGVRVSFGPTDNAILGNSIVDNGELGIDLGAEGVTPNDAGDGDAGENDLQNFPELTAGVAAGSTVVKGRLDSSASSDFRVEVFDNEDDDATNHGEGQTPLGAFDVTTDAAGIAEFAEVLDGTAGAGRDLSATATELDALGNPLSTSEFGLNLEEGTCDVSGTPGDDPALAGTVADEVICGLAGDDVIDGGGGDDVIVGGEGTDEVDYSAAPGAIEADLETGEVSGAGAGADLVAGVEDVTGTDFDDLIVGDALANVLKAGAGDDTIEGRDGDDELVGSDNADTLKGGDGADELKSQDGGDTLRGQSGDDDDLSGGPGKDNLNGGGGGGDHCNGGGNKDDTPAKGCESTSSIP